MELVWKNWLVKQQLKDLVVMVGGILGVGYFIGLMNFLSFDKQFKAI